MATSIDKDEYGAVPNNLIRRRSSLEVANTFLDEFKAATGARLLVFLGFLTALGVGALVGVVPKVLQQRFAETEFGLEEGLNCDDFQDNKPEACIQGANYAQSAASYAVLASNLLALFTNSFAGSYSDCHGRKGVQVLALLFMVGAPILFFAIQVWHSIHPLWYYFWECVARILSPFPIAFTQLSDVLPPKHRAPAFGLFFASFMAGIAIAPFVATLLSHTATAVFSSVVRLLALAIAVVALPETLSTESRLRAAELHEEERLDNEDNNTFCRTMLQPLRKLEILQRSSSLLLLAFGFFAAKMVFSADATLFFYYIESNLGASEADVAGMMFMAGIMGVLVQAGLLKYLITLLGERNLLLVSFVSGTVHNLVYGLAPKKSMMYFGLGLASLTNTNNALLSSLASRMVMTTEQGQIQGALFGLASVAEAIGPVIFNYVYRHWHTFGPGTMFVFGAILYAIGMVAISFVPRSTSSTSVDQEDDIDGSTNFYLSSE